MPKHLQKMANGEWRVRVVVPKDLVPLVGKTALTRPLGTNDEAEAQSRGKKPIENFLSEITEKRRLLNSPKKRWYTFFPNPDYDHPDNAVSDYAYTEETRLFGVTRWGMPSLNMIPVFRRDGSIRGYRSQTPDDPPTPIVILISLWADTRRRPITRKAWNAVIGKITHLFKYLGPVDLDLISPEDLAAFLAALLASGLKPAVVDDYLVYIKSVFAAAKEATVIFANPAENLRRARPTEKHRREGP